MFSQRFLLLLFACGLLGSSILGCTRRVSPETNSISLSIPDRFQIGNKVMVSNMSFKAGENQKIGSFAVGGTFQAQHLRVNVHSNASGGGILAGWAWDACGGHCNDSSQYQPPPSSIQLDVVSGKGRLVQFMAAGSVVDANGNSIEGMTFTYAEKVVDIEGSSTSVALAPIDIGQGQSEGEIKGRYLMADGTGPTGWVNIYMSPASGSPKMLIHRDYMFAGWMNIFFVDGANFSYYMPDLNLPLFDGQTVSTAYMDSLAATPMVSKISSPNFYRTDGGSSPRIETASNNYVGFFGLTSSTNYSVCYQNYDSVIPSIGSSISGNSITGSVWWRTAGASTMYPNDIVRVSGGQPVGGCAGSQNHLDRIPINAADFRNGVHDIVGTRGPFLSSSTSDSILKTISGSTISVAWNYIPQVNQGLGAIDGARVYYKELTSSTLKSEEVFRNYSMEGSDGIDCDQLFYQGWLWEDVTYPSSTVALDTGFTDPYNVYLAVCPKRGSDTIEYGLYPYTGYGPSSQGGPATQLSYTMANPWAHVNACVPTVITARDASYMVTSVTNQHVNVNPTNMVLSENCGGANVTATTMNGSFKWLFAQSASLTSGTVDISSVGLTGTTQTMSFVGATSATNMYWFAPNSYIKRNNCQQIWVGATDNGANIAQLPGPAVVTPSLSGPTGGAFYFDGNCTVPMSTTTITGSGSFIFYKPTNLGGPSYINLNNNIGFTPSSGTWINVDQ